MSEELLPCPFCGTGAQEDWLQCERYYWIMCPECGAESCHLETPQEAIAAWNRRAAQPTGEYGRLRGGIAEAKGLLYEARRVIEGLAAERNLLRRERSLLVELDKARCTVMQGLMGGTVFESALVRVMELGDQIIALHHEALGVELLPGTPCPCILCRPPAEQAGKES